MCIRDRSLYKAIITIVLIIQLIQLIKTMAIPGLLRKTKSSCRTNFRTFFFRATNATVNLIFDQIVGTQQLIFTELNYFVSYAKSDKTSTHKPRCYLVIRELKQRRLRQQRERHLKM